MDKQQLLEYLEKMDAALDHPAMIYIYGSAACILLDEPDRTSLDIDVAGPYSDADYAELVRAAEMAGIPVNPDGDANTNHIEWIQGLRLCLPAAAPERSMLLWQGAKLAIKCGPPADLIASKLIRYDEIDQGDIQFLLSQAHISYDDVADAVKRLPPSFREDCLVIENLQNFRSDIELWNGDRP
jgi:hypothetical protein